LLEPRSVWERALLRYCGDRFGLAEIICRPDECTPQEEATDLLVQTKAGASVVEHTLFNFLPDQEWANARFCEVKNWVFKGTPPDQGACVLVPQAMLVDRQLSKHAHELSQLIAQAISQLPPCAKWARPEPGRFETVHWRGHKIEVFRFDEGTPNRMTRSASEASARADVARIIETKLPKLWADAAKYRARPLLVVECNQIAFGCGGPPLLEELAAQFKGTAVPKDFLGLVIGSHVMDAPEVIVVWDERGSTLSSFDHCRTYYSHHRWQVGEAQTDG